MKWDIAALDAALAKRIQEKKLPGVSVAIRGPEGVLFAKGYGFQDEKHERPVNEHTIMGIASMSKSTATLALAILASEGKCSFDDPVIRYFPSFRLAGTPRQAVTLHHLATHTAGIPPMEPLEWSIAMNTKSREDEETMALRAASPNQMDKIEQIVDYIGEGRYETLGAPGEYMSYSNEGYAILSYVVDQAAGIPLEQFLQQRIFGPIGMTRTLLDQDASEAKKIAGGNITSLWERDEDGAFTVDDDWSLLPPFRSCACVKSTAHDMARYYQCIANGGVIDGRQAIPAKAVELLVGAQFPLTEKPCYCYGLNKRSWNGHVICEHSGGLHGVSTHGALLLHENYGFAALSNEGGQDTDDLCWMMMNMVIGRPLEEEHVFLHPEKEPFADAAMITGRYLAHEGMPSVARVFERDGSLMAERDGNEYRMVYCGGTWFLLYSEAGVRSGRMHFHVRGGRAWGVQIGTRVSMRIDGEPAAAE